MATPPQLFRKTSVYHDISGRETAFRMESAADYGLKIDGIKGESEKAADEIDVYWFRWAESNASRQAGAGKVTRGALQCMKIVDKSSPALFIDCATGKVHPNAVLVSRKAGGKQHDTWKMTMQQVVITNYEADGSGPMPTEVFDLTFDAMEMSYWPQGADGEVGSEVKQKYDFKTNKKV